jgi:pentatricopeptide repeat-containing protein PET309
LRRLRTKERKLEAQLLDEYLIDTLKDFEDILPFAQGESPGNTTSQIKDDALSAKQYLDHVLTVYGAERTLDAVRDLFDRYFTRGVDPPIAILTYLMRTLDSLKQYKEVGTCWALAKEQADRMFAPITLPDMRSSVPDPAIASDGSALSIQAPKPSKKADKQLEITPSSTFGRRLMLSRPALFYIKTLVATNRMSDAIDLVTSLNVEGYSLDNMTWNSFIQHLCTADPPFALLAFQLTERFLIPNFPGWENVFWAKVNIQDQRSGLQHIKARYIAPDHLLPQYQTIIFLSHALLTLRYHESQGMQYLEAEHLQVGGVNLARYVGRLKQIRENAPRTLYAVQCLPLLDDEWQRQLRHEEGTDGNLFAPLSERRKSKETEEDDVGRG